MYEEELRTKPACEGDGDGQVMPAGTLPIVVAVRSIRPSAV